MLSSFSEHLSSGLPYNSVKEMPQTIKQYDGKHQTQFFYFLRCKNLSIWVPNPLT